MTLIFKNKCSCIAAQLASAAALRSTNELVDQLQAQLKAERAQHAFNLAEKEQELSLALRELAELRLELATRDRMIAFAAAGSPSSAVH